MATLWDLLSPTSWFDKAAQPTDWMGPYVPPSTPQQMSAQLADFAAAVERGQAQPLKPQFPLSPTLRVGSGLTLAALMNVKETADSIGRTVGGVGSAMRGEWGSPTSDEFMQHAVPWAAEAAMNVGLSNMPRAGVGGSLGMFGGRLAKNAPLDALMRAEQMEAAGATPDDIWRATGWGRGADGEWRFEIDDSAAALTERVGAPFDAADVGQTLPYEYAERTLMHPELHDAYSLPNVQLTKGGGYPFTPSGQYRVRQSGLEEIGIEAGNRDQTLPLALHEFQHAIQRREGFAGGFDAVNGDLTPYREEIFAEALRLHKQEGMPLGDALARTEAKKRAELYEAASGEVEARNVEARRRMTALQRIQTPPWATEDVPRAQQFVGTRK